MENNMTNTNKVFIMGEICTDLTFSHEMYGENFYEFMVSVKRLSGQDDVIPVTASERLLGKDKLKKGDKVAINGQFRSYNKLIDNKSKLMLTVFVKDFMPYDESFQNPNEAVLTGYVCKPPVYRTTPFNREICDVLLAINRSYKKSDYIPCIAWGRNARFSQDLEVGRRITVSGRIQSREYTKKLGETSETRVAYELSVSKIVCESDDASEEIAQTEIEEQAQ
ncbi:MAG: single-stranded DNA-binding protein [Clostridiales bacterium]|nr:single-stranded DNA-binding protein [Clostridiales bacterium]